MDLLNAIKELSTKVSQLSKNQQILEKNLDYMQKSVWVVDSDVQTGVFCLTLLVRCWKAGPGWGPTRPSGGMQRHSG